MPQSPGMVREVAVAIAAVRTLTTLGRLATLGPRPSAYGLPATSRYSGWCGRATGTGGGGGGGGGAGCGAAGRVMAGNAVAGSATATTERSSPSALSGCGAAVAGTGAITCAAVCTTA